MSSSRYTPPLLSLEKLAEMNVDPGEIEDEQGSGWIFSSPREKSHSSLFAETSFPCAAFFPACLP